MKQFFGFRNVTVNNVEKEVRVRFVEDCILAVTIDRVESSIDIDNGVILQSEISDFVVARLALDNVTVTVTDKNDLVTGDAPTVIGYEEVSVNAFTKKVAVKIAGETIFAVISNVRFIWNYAADIYPTVETGKVQDADKAQKYARR